MTHSNKNNFVSTNETNAVNKQNKNTKNMSTTTVSLPVTRNEVSWNYVLSPLKKKNPTDSVRYAFVPESVNDKVPGRTANDFIAHMGADLVPLVFKQVRGKAAFISKIAENEATPKDDKDNVTGPVDPDKMKELFVKYMTDLSVKGETLKSLLDEKEDLIESFKLLASNNDMDMMEKMAKVNEIGTRIKQLDEAIEDRKKSNTKDEED